MQDMISYNLAMKLGQNLFGLKLVKSNDS